MDTSYPENYSVPIKSFVGNKQAFIFNVFKKHQFSGQVKFVPPDQPEWRFYISMGRLICGTGGEHSVRRWRRHLAVYLPDIASDRSFLEGQLKSLSQNNVKFCWEYELLRSWILEGRANRDAAIKMITEIITEIFFDLNQCSEITFHINQEISIPMEEQICFFDAADLITLAWQKWQKWLNFRLADRSPNKAPVILSPIRLEQKMSPKTYKLFAQVFNGRNTLRDVAIKLKKDVHLLTGSLLPYIQEGIVDLVSVKDLPSPIPVSTEKPVNTNLPLIACIDYSQGVCETIGTILAKAGYRFVGITESLKAIAQILALKPDLIFLDLTMPNIDGYKIAASLKKLSTFKDTPIIILSSNDNMIERVRRQMIGASDFINKPINSQELLAMVQKHLSSKG